MRSFSIIFLQFPNLAGDLGGGLIPRLFFENQSGPRLPAGHACLANTNSAGRHSRRAGEQELEQITFFNVIECPFC
ncbi:MAG: hypothetical protein H6559_25360 [Lewinellaceae bacterium]|nr:hypothetical protein [Lewinellaceae bacterium]